LQVFFSPGGLFDSLRERPAWIGAMIVVSVLVGFSLVLIPSELWVEFTRNRMIEQGQEIPQGFESSGGIMRIFSVAGGIIATPIMMFILAGVVTFVFNFIFGDEGRYTQYLAVVAHASVITALGSLLLVPLKVSQGDPSLTLSLGTFAFPLQEGYLLRVLRLLDLFALWSYGVMAVGVTRIDPRRGFAFALTFFMLFALAFALIFGSFGG
jgi:hypothetical protein